MIVQYGRTYALKCTNRVNSTEVEIQDVRITFNISKKEKIDENEITLSIYNLSPNTRGLLVAPLDVNKNGQILVELSCGYQEDNAIIFKGFCEAKSLYSPPNWVTTLKGKEGAKEYEDFDFEKTYPAGTPIQRIVTDIAKKSETELSLGKIPITGTLPRGRAFTGKPKQIIEALQNKYGFQFTIQNGVTKVQGGSAKVIPDIGTAKLDPETGLLGRPYRDGDIVRTTCLINPKIIVGSAIQLFVNANSPLNGFYMVKKMSCRGDSWGGSWQQELELSVEGAGPEIFSDKS